MDQPISQGKNKNIVLSFFDMAFNQGKPEEACVEYVGDTYIQHNPGVDDGAHAFVEFVRKYREQYPDLHVEVKQAIEENDLVALHSLSKATPEDRGVAGVDIFKLKDGKIMEHWDVLQPIPANAANRHPMF